jgi:hypothetical protein
MAGYMDFNSPRDFNSLMGYGTSTPISGLTGQPDYLQSLQSPSLAGIDMGAGGPTSMSDSIMNSLKGFGGGFFDKTNAAGIKDQGWGGTALGVASGLGNAYMGMQQYGLAKDQLNFSKQQYETNLKNQTKLTNASLADRQASRVASNPSAYQSVGDYIKQYGV